jgi:UDP-3-O-[3-hydroxymyristoyl] glucosamine N-acyltransferase
VASKDAATPSLTAAEVAKLAAGELVGDGAIRLSGFAPLDRAGPGDLSFLTTNRYLAQFLASKAGAVLCTEENRSVDGGPPARIIVKNVHQAMLQILRMLFPDPPRPKGIEPTAVIGAGAVIGQDVYLGPYAIVGPGAKIGDRTVVMAHCVIGDGVQIGEDCTLHPQVVLYPRAVLHNRVILHAGVRIASDGYGYQPGKNGHERIPHVARSIIEDDVEIGANSCIDRGSVSDTVIGAGSKLDNMVHIAHNVRIGKRCLIMAFVGIAGSTIVEDDVILAGQVGVTGHLTIARGTKVAAQAGIIGTTEPNSVLWGTPARDHRGYLRQVAAINRLTPIVRELEEMVKRERNQAE